MRTVFVLLLAMLAIKTTSAVGQDACSNGYTSCLDKCVARPSKTLQDSCMETCQTQNNACFSKVLGGPGPTAVTVKEDAPKGDSVAADGERPAAKPAAKKQVATPAKPAERRAQ